MGPLEITLLIVVIVVLVIGPLIFFLSGIYKVKKNQVMVIEKIDTFYKLYEEGKYFLMPILYKRRGVYTLGKQTRLLKIEGLKDIEITFEINDVKKYHYSKDDVISKINEVYYSGVQIDEEILKNSLMDIGVTFISARTK